ncbi:unnamed protein product [Ectocarpus sp. 8 AP-2014]
MCERTHTHIDDTSKDVISLHRRGSWPRDFIALSYLSLAQHRRTCTMNIRANGSIPNINKHLKNPYHALLACQFLSTASTESTHQTQLFLKTISKTKVKIMSNSHLNLKQERC